MTSKAQVKVKLGHVVQIHVSRLPFAVSVTLNLLIRNLSISLSVMSRTY